MNTEEVNRKAIASLLSLPENKACFDCTSRDPRWGSLSFGVFICINCAGGHRKNEWRVKSSDLDKWSQDDVNKMKHAGNTKAKQLYNTLLPPPRAFDQGREHMAYLKDKYSKKARIEISKEKSAPNVKLSVSAQLAPIAPPSSTTSVPYQLAPKREIEIDLITMESPSITHRHAPPPVMRAQSSPNVLLHMPRYNTNSFESGTVKESIMSMYTTPIAPKPTPAPTTPAPPVGRPAYPAPNYHVNFNSALSPTLNPYFNLPMIPAVPVQPNYNVHIGAPSSYGGPGYSYGYAPSVGTIPAGMPFYSTSPPPQVPRPAAANNPHPQSKLNDFSLL